MKKSIILIGFIFGFLATQAQETKLDKTSFNALNLSYPGLEQVNKSVNNGDYEKAAQQLLQSY